MTDAPAGIKIVSKEEFAAAKAAPITPLAQEILDKHGPATTPFLNEDEVKALEERLDTPIAMQKNMAAKLKLYLDMTMARELNERGVLSDATRRWVEIYNSLLDAIHKNKYGDKSLNLHLHAVTHSQIASLMRKARKVPPRKERTEEEHEADQSSEADPSSIILEGDAR